MEENPSIEPGLPELVGVAEAALLLGLSKGALGERRRKQPRGGPAFPRPVAKLACGPIWLRTQIEQYRTRVEDDRQQPLWDQEPEPVDERLERALHRLSLSDLQRGDR